MSFIIEEIPICHYFLSKLLYIRSNIWNVAKFPALFNLLATQLPMQKFIIQSNPHVKKRGQVVHLTKNPRDDSSWRVIDDDMWFRRVQSQTYCTKYHPRLKHTCDKFAREKCAPISLTSFVYCSCTLFIRLAITQMRTPPPIFLIPDFRIYVPFKLNFELKFHEKFFTFTQKYKYQNNTLCECGVCYQ